MSYIRSGSNPEQLYIWGDGTDVYVVKGPKSIGKLPRDIMNGLIKKYHKNHHPDDGCKFKGAKIEEVWVDSKDQLLPEDRTKGMENFVLPFDYKIKLSYGDWHIIMWYVTWCYIVNTNLKR